MNEKWIAIPIAAPTLEEALGRIPEAEPLADVIEFRLDYLTDLPLDDAWPGVNRLVQATSLPVILTFHANVRRPGGPIPTFEQQVALWRSLFPLAGGRPIYFDLELRLVEWFHAMKEPVPWKHVIASHHNFKETPATLLEIYKRMRATPAEILKIATQAQDISDNLSLFIVHQQAQRDRRPFIGLAMGEAGVMSRVLSPVWGGWLTFGALRPDEPTAPGQLTAKELRQLYRLPELSDDSQITGVIGDPVGHSLSPRLHNTAYKQLDLDWVYLPLLVKDLGRFMGEFVNPSSRRLSWNLRGLSVTLPHKVDIRSYLDQLDPVAEQVGAVNTVVIESDRLVGYNTDVEGAMRPLRERLDVKGSRAVVLGAGGAARAVGFGLRQAGAQVRVLARNAAQAIELADRLGGQAGSLADVATIEYDVLINTTPVGLKDSPSESPVPAYALRPGTVVFDLIPRREVTKLLADAQAAGCRTISGLEMLVYQAARQFELWTHCRAPLDVMFQAVALTSERASAAEGD